MDHSNFTSKSPIPGCPETDSGCWLSFDGSEILQQPFSATQDDQMVGIISPSSSSSSPTDKLSRAIQTLQSMIRDTSVLIQIWVPITEGPRSFLITINQPFLCDQSSISLAGYRYASENYLLSADGDSMESLGLPGRVFLRKVPESTEDVRRFREEECPRLKYAWFCDVRGSIALPVFEKMTGKCLGVIEIVTTDQFMITYRPVLVEAVCRALEAVDLRSSEIDQGGNEPHSAELLELLNITRTICDKHRLPLGQTWISCTQESNCRLSNLHDNTMHCASIVRSACYVRDLCVSDFHKACSDNHLLKGQGVVGKAFETNKPSYAIDITTSGDGYLLSRHAEHCGFRGGAVGVHVKSLHGACRSYVLEFLLPLEFQGNGIVFHCKIMEDVTMMVSESRNFSLSSGKRHAQPSSSSVNDRILDQSWISTDKRQQGSAMISFVGRDQQGKTKGVRGKNPCNTIGPHTNPHPKPYSYGDTNQDQLLSINPQIRTMMQSPEFLQSLTTEEILQQMATIQKILSARLIPQPNQTVASENPNVSRWISIQRS